jgi:hypothetical protein
LISALMLECLAASLLVFAAPQATVAGACSKEYGTILENGAGNLHSNAALMCSAQKPSWEVEAFIQRQVSGGWNSGYQRWLDHLFKHVRLHGHGWRAQLHSRHLPDEDRHHQAGR